MELASLRELFVEELSDVYSAEKQITKALPKMIRAANFPELESALKDHLEVTEEQVRRLEEIFEGLKVSPKRKKCKGMEGLLEEGGDMLKKDADEAVLDAGIISAAQRVEHYEIAAYGTLRTYAETLGEKKAAKLLQQTLQEEKDADVKLTKLAEGTINQEAAAGSRRGPRAAVVKGERGD